MADTATLRTEPLASAVRKATRHLMPMLVILYFVAFLDRTNVGFAEAALQTDRGISAGAFALGAGIFFIGYAIFEIPSNLALKRFGARWWLARIAITWGLVAAAFAFTTNDTMFIILRFLLGVTEAGLFPGVIMFLAEWFPNKVRVRMFAIFYLAQPFSQMLGAPLSGGLISFGDQYTPWAGWQVMFFSEGMLAVIAGVAAIFLLIDTPQKAKWLNDDEKRALIDVMAREDAVRQEDGPTGIWRAMANWKVWYFTVIYFCLQIAVYGTTFYLPQQVAGLLGQDVGWQVGLVTAMARDHDEGRRFLITDLPHQIEAILQPELQVEKDHIGGIVLDLDVDDLERLAGAVGREVGAARSGREVRLEPPEAGLADGEREVGRVHRAADERHARRRDER